jgi:hypothetical protein
VETNLTYLRNVESGVVAIKLRLPGDEIEILDVRPKNGGALDEAKMSGQGLAGGMNSH